MMSESVLPADMKSLTGSLFHAVRKHGPSCGGMMGSARKTPVLLKDDIDAIVTSPLPHYMEQAPCENENRKLLIHRLFSLLRSSEAINTITRKRPSAVSHGYS